jgi:hypothetical protein
MGQCIKFDFAKFLELVVFIYRRGIKLWIRNFMQLEFPRNRGYPPEFDSVS